MPTLRDCAFAELALRQEAVTQQQLDQAKAMQAELAQQKITRPLSAVLLDRKALTRDVMKALTTELAAHSVRCQECSKLSPLSRLDFSGELACFHCKRPLTRTYDRISAEDLLLDALAESVPAFSGRSGSTRSAPGATKRQSFRARPAAAPATSAPPSAANASSPAAPAAPTTPAAPSPPVEKPVETAPAIGEVLAAELAEAALVTRHRLQQPAGFGPCGRLYIVKEAARALAVKIFDQALGATKSGFHRWADYMKKAHDLSSQATPKPVQFFKERGVAYSVRPYVGDPSWCWAERMAQPAGAGMVLARAEDAILAVLRALGEFHAAGICHGNVKPANVLLGGEGATLLDPGLFLLLSGLDSRERYRRRAGVTRYLAPECLDDAEPTPAADLFAAGRLLEDLLVLAPPGKSGDIARRARLERLAAMLAAIRPGDRPASAGAALAWMSENAAEAPPRAALRRRLAAARVWPRRLISGRMPQAAGIAALGLVCGLIAWQTLGGHAGGIADAAGARADEVLERSLRHEIEALSSAGSSSAAGAAHERRWQAASDLVEGTHLAPVVADARAAALSERQRKERAALAPKLALAQAAADNRDWISAVRELVKAGAAAEGDAGAGALRTRILDGLLDAHDMVLVPAPADGDGRSSGAPFLIDTRPHAGPGSVVATQLTFAQAERLARTQSKRLPTAEEWDRAHAMTGGSCPEWLQRHAREIAFVPDLFEWVVGPENEWSSRGYGFCRGTGGAGVPATHPQLRKKSAGHVDVGVRFALSLSQ